MDAKKLFGRIDELAQEYLQMWIDICNIESPTKFKPGVDAVGKYFIEKAEAKGWKVEVHHEDVSGDAVCITMNPEAPGKAICFSGHMDTVHPVGSFGTPAVRVEEDKIYGPGVADCKGGLVAAFLAMDALAGCGFTARPVKLILQSDEEVGSGSSEKRTLDFMEACAKDCELFLNAEKHSAGKVCTKRKGIAKYRLVVHGVASHACGCWENPANAIREAARLVMEVEKFKEPDGITMNCGIISGGQAVNMVPDRCEVTLEARYPTVSHMERADAFLQELAQSSGCPGITVELQRLGCRMPMEQTPATMRLLERLNQVYAKLDMPVLTTVSSPGGSDASDMTARGLPVLDSVGVRGKMIHSVDEYALVSSLPEAAKRLAAAAAFL